MNDREDIKQPQDHLPPEDEREDGDEIEQPRYPGTGAPTHEGAASPETAAEPGKPLRHGVDKLPPSGR